MLNDPKTRAVVAGVAGGMLGSLFAEAVLGAPQSLAATTVFGCLTGLGIGALFGVSEGIGAGTSSIGVRAAVIGGLYPVSTILLAHFILGERLTGGERVGVAMALAAVVLTTLP